MASSSFEFLSKFHIEENKYGEIGAMILSLLYYFKMEFFLPKWYFKAGNVNSCENNWVKFSTVSNYEIGNTTGNYTIYAYFKDAAGNISTTAVSDSIKYDRDAIACTLVDYGDFIRISTIGERELADKPYSNALDSGWNDNDKLAKSSNISDYFTYIKDVDGETNYCEYSIKDD